MAVGDVAIIRIRVLLKLETCMEIFPQYSRGKPHE